MNDNTIGTYVPDPSDTSGYNSDKIGEFIKALNFFGHLNFYDSGIAWVTFDQTSGSSGKATPRIFVGVANLGSNNIFVTNDGGSTCMYRYREHFIHSLCPHRVCRFRTKHYLPAA